MTLRKDRLGNGHHMYVTESYTYGTDAILLAEFARHELPRAKCVADFGAGSGIIPLYWCAEAVDYAHIDAVEIQAEGCELFRRSVSENGWTEKISVHHRDLREAKDFLVSGSYDLITCNPPYGRVGGTLLNPSEARATARHECCGTFEEIALSAARLLKYNGRFCVCQRPERLATVMFAMRDAGIEPKVLQTVQFSAEREPKLFLLCGRKGGKDGMRILPTLFLNQSSPHW